MSGKHYRLSLIVLSTHEEPWKKNNIYIYVKLFSTKLQTASRCEKKRKSPSSALQQVVIITHLMFNQRPLKTCRTFGLMHIMRPISSHQHLKEKALVICNDQKGCFNDWAETKQIVFAIGKTCRSAQKRLHDWQTWQRYIWSGSATEKNSKRSFTSNIYGCNICGFYGIYVSTDISLHSILFPHHQWIINICKTVLYEDQNCLYCLYTRR